MICRAHDEIIDIPLRSSNSELLVRTLFCQPKLTNPEKTPSSKVEFLATKQTAVVIGILYRQLYMFHRENLSQRAIVTNICDPRFAEKTNNPITLPISNETSVANSITRERS